MTKQSILNKSERLFQTPEGDLSPKGQAAFSNELCERLVTLYPGELVLVGSVKDDEDTDDIEKLTAAQIRKELDEADPVIDYPSNANKAALVELLKAKRESEAALASGE